MYRRKNRKTKEIKIKEIKKEKKYYRDKNRKKKERLNRSKKERTKEREGELKKEVKLRGKKVMINEYRKETNVRKKCLCVYIYWKLLVFVTLE